MINWAELWQRFLNFLKPQPPPPPPCPGGMKIGLTAFGSPSTFNLLKAINEFNSYIGNNSKLKLDIRFMQAEKLAHEEIPQYAPKLPEVCYMVTPQSLSAASRAKLATGVKTEIVVYDTQDKINCYGGLQWGNAVPFICIPYNNALNWDYGWKTSLAPCLVHEFTHALYAIIGAKGFQGLPNIDKAPDYGFTEQNDPGWLNFRKYCLGKITQEMANVLMKD